MGVVKYLAPVCIVLLAIGAFELAGPLASFASALQVFLLILLGTVRFCGAGPALLALVVGAGEIVRYMVTPGGFVVSHVHDWVALIAFVMMAIVGGDLARRAERRAAEAQRQRAEIERLYAQLQAAFDRASEAEAAVRGEQLKATLLDALTHNLRTPLTSIKAAVTALIGGRGWEMPPFVPEVRRELLQVIDEESDRLNRFIEGLSTAGPSSSGRPLFAPVRVQDVVNAGLARAESLTRDHRVTVRIDDDLPAVSADAASVGEVVYMLLDNASKYAPVGTTIEVRACRDDDHHVRVSVADQGPGIPAELRERVFEKFYRIPARAPQDPRRKGVGLGLPIARRLIEAQGGRLWVEAAPSGRGTMAVMALVVAEVVPAPEEGTMAAVAD